MKLAQQLYEGVEIKGSGMTALITYLRTDSTRVSQEAQKSAKEFIEKNTAVIMPEICRPQESPMQKFRMHMKP